MVIILRTYFFAPWDTAVSRKVDIYLRRQQPTFGRIVQERNNVLRFITAM